MENQQKQFIITAVVISVLASFVFGLLGGGLAWELAKTGKFGFPSINTISQGSSNKIATTQQEQAVVETVKEVSPAVVSVIATKDLPVIENQSSDPLQNFLKGTPFEGFFSPGQSSAPQQRGTEKKEVGGGTGFIISSDGLILTNKHVVDIDGAEYTVLANDGQKYPAKVLAKDPVQDIAVLKINKDNLPVVKLGDSAKIDIGQTAIAIGNALGEFRNTVSVGVVSGLQRSISAAGGGSVESLDNLIQTDTAINPGNSGGPLLNLSGEVVGVNVAMASGAQSIGFALPINLAKKDIEQVKKFGKISYPFLGIRYTIIDQGLKEKNNLPVDYGALIIKGNGDSEPAIAANSPADKAGLKENDIILEADGQKIDKDHPLAKIVQNHNIGDGIILKVLSNGKERDIKVILGER